MSPRPTALPLPGCLRAAQVGSLYNSWLERGNFDAEERYSDRAQPLPPWWIARVRPYARSTTGYRDSRSSRAARVPAL
jgi:hypothetical protein